MMKSILCLTSDGVQLIRDAKFAEYVPKIFSDFVFTPMPSDVEGLNFYDAHVSLLKEAKIGGYGYFGSKKYLDYLRTVFERLAAASFPAITGLPLDPFDYSSASRSNAFFRNKCFESKPRLTPYGEVLLEGTANWRDHNQVDYWWGGTHITNDNYWSFDPIAEKLKQS